ncbi:hypothetical protein ACFSC4_09520 [Deinococcus malanensis]|uniref:hypothetical protein n=1 Tax=Deinococcus malanensis TaxID=1706855 RepID=UPI0036386EBE
MHVTELLERVALVEAQAHARYGLTGAVGYFGPLTAVYAAPGLVLNTAWHGGSGLPSSEDLNAFEAFSGQYGQAPTLHLLSHAAPTLLPELERRGYVLTSMPHLYTRHLRDLPPVGDFAILEENDPEQWAQWSAQGFGGGWTSCRR